MSFNVVVAALAGVLCVLCVHRTVAMHTFPATAVEGDTRTCADAHGQFLLYSFLHAVCNERGS